MDLTPANEFYTILLTLGWGGMIAAVVIYQWIESRKNNKK